MATMSNSSALGNYASCKYKGDLCLTSMIEVPRPNDREALARHPEFIATTSLHQKRWTIEGGLWLALLLLWLAPADFTDSLEELVVYVNLETLPHHLCWVFLFNLVNITSLRRIIFKDQNIRPLHYTQDVKLLQDMLVDKLQPILHLPVVVAGYKVFSFEPGVAPEKRQWDIVAAQHVDIGILPLLREMRDEDRILSDRFKTMMKNERESPLENYFDVDTADFLRWATSDAGQSSDASPQADTPPTSRWR
ncbi:uncharacterized protein BDZ99DRAFT_470849 [Mytilinidion resinicola]|uniref:Uncharacterized protein n=1 Tax=Mytilinidion resinicola TaxID=574789 RepID=A0A6A6Z9V0_9PEZI|nr:uncharacterized protein BDZ99DRAFT_470849 [Mytilinidion resinicola]KAF2817902.1 hypothetical protein BDZ99DRAFT_470849 [Mytilinidion resinicola]